MLSYLLVILSLKKLENRSQTDEKTDWDEDIQMDTKTKKKPKKPTLPHVNPGLPERVSVLSTKCDGCHTKGLIVASSHNIKKIVIITILTLICQSQLSVLLDKNKSQVKPFFPLVPPNFCN